MFVELLKNQCDTKFILYPLSDKKSCAFMSGSTMNFYGHLSTMNYDEGNYETYTGLDIPLKYLIFKTLL